MVLAILEIGGDVAFTVLGAVVVSAVTAYVTARTTNQRLEKQLRAESARMDSQLAAEKERQADQLRHDRELSDLAELRSLLDETSQLVSLAVKTSAQVAANWPQREADDPRERLEVQRQALRDVVVEIAECHQRIMLRLPRDSEVSVSLNEIRQRIAELVVRSGPDPLVGDSDDDFMENEEGALAVADAHVMFLDVSRRIVGTQLPP